jgi:2-dehydro-3-deoxygalactonokinase
MVASAKGGRGLDRGGPFIAVDWGTSNRRAWRIAPGGAVEEQFADARGVLTFPDGGFPEEVAFLRQKLGDLPMLMGGMIGSNRGWHAVPYVPCPADLREIAAGIQWIDSRTGIVPGVAQERRDAPDVMRGEEVQILGALVTGDLPDGALACLPGTHAKWVRLTEGRIASFTTWMTGEIFALLRDHSILAPQLAGDTRAAPGPGFTAGVVASGEGDPLGQLFRIRAAQVLDTPMADAPGFVSGLLIGAEVRAGMALMRGEIPYLIGRPDLCARYAAAIAQVRGQAREEALMIDGSAAFRAGIGVLLRKLS